MVRIVNLVNMTHRHNNKRFVFEVGYYCKPNPDTSNEEPNIIAKFKNFTDAQAFAYNLANTPDATQVLIRS